MFKASQSLLRFGPRALNGSIRPPAIVRPASVSLTPRQNTRLRFARFASNKPDKPDDKSDQKDPPPPPKKIDYEAEREIGQRKLEPHPEEVSSDSSTTRKWDSTTPVMKSPGTADETSLNSGLKHDVNIVKNTFDISNVPREAKALGLAGTIPYMATSLSTIFLAWSLGKELPTGNSLYDAVHVNHETAERLLHMLEPIQLGYGAVIISFLGAIHWGLEFAEKQPELKRTRFRYGMGLASSIVAWPTLLMPFEYALTAQWAAFVGLYFADSRAKSLGWAPKWYAVYRFLLTTIVGFAILISLVGRAHMSQHGRLTSEGISSSLSKPGLADTNTNWTELEKKEKEKIKKEKEEAERKAKKEAAEKKKQEKKAKGNEKKLNETKQSGDDEKKQDGGDKSSSGKDKDSAEKEDDNGNEKDNSKNKDESDDAQGKEAEDNDKSQDKKESEDKKGSEDKAAEDNDKNQDEKESDDKDSGDKDEDKATSEKKKESKK